MPIHPGFFTTFYESIWNLDTTLIGDASVPNVDAYKFTIYAYCDNSMPKKVVVDYYQRYFASKGGSFIVADMLDDPTELIRFGK